MSRYEEIRSLNNEIYATTDLASGRVQSTNFFENFRGNMLFFSGYIRGACLPAELGISALYKIQPGPRAPMLFRVVSFAISSALAVPLIALSAALAAIPIAVYVAVSPFAAIVSAIESISNISYNSRVHRAKERLPYLTRKRDALERAAREDEDRCHRHYYRW